MFICPVLSTYYSLILFCQCVDRLQMVLFVGTCFPPLLVRTDSLSSPLASCWIPVTFQLVSHWERPVWGRPRFPFSTWTRCHTLCPYPSSDSNGSDSFLLYKMVSSTFIIVLLMFLMWSNTDIRQLRRQNPFLHDQIEFFFFCNVCIPKNRV